MAHPAGQQRTAEGSVYAFMIRFFAITWSRYNFAPRFGKSAPAASRCSIARAWSPRRSATSASPERETVSTPHCRALGNGSRLLLPIRQFGGGIESWCRAVLLDARATAVGRHDQIALTTSAPPLPRRASVGFAYGGVKLDEGLKRGGDVVRGQRVGEISAGGGGHSVNEGGAGSAGDEIAGFAGRRGAPKVGVIGWQGHAVAGTEDGCRKGFGGGGEVGIEVSHGRGIIPNSHTPEAGVTGFTAMMKVP